MFKDMAPLMVTVKNPNIILEAKPVPFGVFSHEYYTQDKIVTARMTQGGFQGNIICGHIHLDKTISPFRGYLKFSDGQPGPLIYS